MTAPPGWIELQGERGPIWVPEATVRAVEAETRRADGIAHARYLAFLDSLPDDEGDDR